MSQHNPRSRTYLIVVLTATVICFALAKLILGSGHGESHTATEHDSSHQTEASGVIQNETKSQSLTGDSVTPSDEIADDGVPAQRP